MTAPASDKSAGVSGKGARLPPEVEKGARVIAKRLAPLLKALEAY